MTEEWIGKTGRRTDQEVQMLDMTPECEPNSRLSCQVVASEEHDGLTVRLPEYQM